MSTDIMNKNAKIFIAGHRGLVGSALLRKFQSNGFSNLIVCDRAELDLVNQSAVQNFFFDNRPDVVIIAAAMVGGIHANSSYSADFIKNNLQIQTNLIDSAYQNGTNKLLFLGSSCIYPRLAPQPINEDCLLTGPLEDTNKGYAIAKIAGIEMCQAYRKQHGFNAISVMPTNLYGPGDNFCLEDSHVVPALIRKVHEAKDSGSNKVLIWGSGKPKREFLYVDDLSDACLFLIENYNEGQLLNIGWGEDISVKKLAELVGSVIGYTGEFYFDISKPDGAPRKLLDVSRLQKLGWRATTTLRVGIENTYKWYLNNIDTCRS